MNDQSKNEIAEAKTLDGVNIHLGFISQTMTEMKQDIKETKAQIASIKDSFITSSVFADHIKIDEDHETRIRANRSDIDGLRSLIDQKVDGIKIRIAWYVGLATGALAIIQCSIGWYLIFRK